MASNDRSRQEVMVVKQAVTDVQIRLGIEHISIGSLWGCKDALHNNRTYEHKPSSRHERDNGQDQTLFGSSE